LSRRSPAGCIDCRDAARSRRSASACNAAMPGPDPASAPASGPGRWQARRRLPASGWRRTQHGAAWHAADAGAKGGLPPLPLHAPARARALSAARRAADGGGGGDADRGGGAGGGDGGARRRPQGEAPCEMKYGRSRGCRLACRQTDRHARLQTDGQTCSPADRQAGSSRGQAQEAIAEASCIARARLKRLGPPTVCALDLSVSTILSTRLYSLV
jgi:hypothetical protein